MTTIEPSTDELAKRIIIEGPDCVGKDTFIARLISFVQGKDGHHGLNQVVTPTVNWRNLKTNQTYAALADIPEQYLLHPNPANYANQEAFEAAQDEAQIEFSRLYESVPGLPLIEPIFANVLSYRSIHSKDGSKESAAFIEALDKGEITDQRQIAEEYLQVHFDLENLAKDLDTTLSMVLMNRSLISYYAMQIHALGYDDLKEKWQKLWNYSRQGEALYVRLTAPEEVVRERLAKRQGNDFRGEIENFYMAKWQAIEQGFIDVQNKRLCAQTITIDTSRSDYEIDQDILKILNWVVYSELYESVNRQLG